MTQRDEGHDYRDSKNKAMEYERRKKKKEEEEIRKKKKEEEKK